MDEKYFNKSIRYLVFLSFVIMITLNVLANILPINGQTTGEVSDFYVNLFAPAGITFGIWGVIYVLLLMYVVYQFGLGNRQISQKLPLFNRVGQFFSLSSIMNAIWIIAWHNHYIILSFLLMIIILISLIYIVLKLKNATLSYKDKIFLKLPFSIYLGWITIATIANATTLLVSLQWNGFGISEVNWMMAILIVSFIIGALASLRLKDVGYGLVLVWAYIGIIIRHTSIDYLHGLYPNIVIVASICAAFMIIIIGYQLIYPKE